MNILVCDDDKEICDAIKIYLENEGYKILKAFNGAEALEVIDEHEIHLVIMDIMMPQMDGLRATMKIREDNNIPVIMLSAKTEDTDKILGLNMGADDYITKPFNPLELIARVKSQLRRYTTLGSLDTKSNVYKTGGLVIDDELKTITVDGDEVKLTPVQYKILRLLTANAGRVFSIDEIYEKVWKETAFCPENTVAVHIRKIREKIEINPKEPKYLKVVWGIGYKVEKI
ncbi:response regulator with CheY-like receiver domain and winged-helix DNA-binding domain [Desulfosporosinus orientis DSM 765]|uniref:Stage 0 sporulation protein A homolog n=1 Tax=Desulfosporosinus orientis (strain ATCC 19365 / DSM 765 / NCIMB 8382 / VKM B-1628 / Singapore I) TaxID=768706 RepID=G7W569_DESOD|nr:response regulator transcription factor [Desulfosporosinus orientis]AET66085.1 response regulator with CheY-like receiver domain and winged-helix DNA-binding domain [Desulfosporosinus orientis DSM 765]